MNSLILILSWIIVALGQPASWPILAPLAASLGYAMSWYVLAQKNPKARFLWGLSWFMSIQLYQLYWLVSHPFNYIYVVWIGLSLLEGVQYGLFCLLLGQRYASPLLLASVWTLFEWSRLFFLTGFPFNPAGLALTATLASLQSAAIMGIYGLTFWVFFCNGLAFHRRWKAFALAALLPYVYGACVLTWDSHEEESATVLVVDSTFLAEELEASNLQELVALVEKEWRTMLEALAKKRNVTAELILFSEETVPFGAKHPFYKEERVVQTFKDVFGGSIEEHLSLHTAPCALCKYVKGSPKWFATNGYWARGISSFFNADTIMGLEGEVGGSSLPVAGALLFRAGEGKSEKRYEAIYGKQLLFPIAEKIPYEWLKPLAARYGISDSFAEGKGPEVFDCKLGKVGLAICYEEFFGHLMRETRLAGADYLLSLNNDVWYPRSSLAKQHFDHGRVRAVELGVPLIRSCNFGLSAAVDCRGRILGLIDGNSREEGSAEVLVATIPKKQIWTPYLIWGDKGILFLCLFGIICGVISMMRFLCGIQQGQDCQYYQSKAPLRWRFVLPQKMMLPQDAFLCWDSF